MLAHLVRLHHAGHKRKVFVMDNSEQKQSHVCGDCAVCTRSLVNVQVAFLALHLCDSHNSVMGFMPFIWSHGAIVTPCT